MAHAAEKKEFTHKEVFTPVQEAKALMDQKKFKEAIDKLQGANKVASKTAYETYIVNLSG